MIDVSVIIPAYNAEHTIAKTIESALAQNYSGAEIVVVNDGSIDSTARVLEGYSDRVRILHQANRGPSAARNAGAKIARGGYLAFLDADDLWLPGKLATSVAALRENPRAVLAFSDAISRDDHGVERRPAPRGHAPSMEDLLGGTWTILPSAVVMRRGTFIEAGGFAEEFRRPGGEDPFMWLVAREYGEFVYLPEPLAVHLAHPAGCHADKYWDGRAIFIRLVRRRYGRNASRLVKQANRTMAAYLMAKASHQLDARDFRGAGFTLIRAAWTSPRHFCTGSILRRVLLSRNIRRISAAASAARTDR
jgi:glycosyltransferase involved in cell wall biosynthesis